MTAGENASIKPIEFLIYAIYIYLSFVFSSLVLAYYLFISIEINMEKKQLHSTVGTKNGGW